MLRTQNTRTIVASSLDQEHSLMVHVRPCGEVVFRIGTRSFYVPKGEVTALLAFITSMMPHTSLEDLRLAQHGGDGLKRIEDSLPPA